MAQNRIAKEEHCNLVKEMQFGNQESFSKYFRMTSNLFEEVLSLVAPLISKSDSKQETIRPTKKLAVTLRYLSTGDFHQTIAFNYRLGHSTVNKITPETCQAVWAAFSPLYVACLRNAKESENVAQDFWEKWNFPFCIGGLDGKHVYCHCPPNSGYIYLNFHKRYSIEPKPLCSARYCYLLVAIGAIGSANYRGIFTASSIKSAIY